MKMLFSLIVVILSVSATFSITPVPGIITVRLLRTNQISNNTYRAGSIVHYTVQLKNVPINDNVRIGIEIRGSNPNGGPRGYISTARPDENIKDFVREMKNGLRFELVPEEIYASYTWFLRPHVYYANESLVSTNMMNAGASATFNVMKK